MESGSWRERNHSRADDGNSQLLGRRETDERGETGDEQPIAAGRNFEYLAHPGVSVLVGDVCHCLCGSIQAVLPRNSG